MLRITHILRCAVILVLFCSVSCLAQERDTLSYYNPDSGFVFFKNPLIKVQAARFINPAPGFISQVSVTLDGYNINGTARLRIFGHEGGGPAPVFEDDLIEPVILKKSRAGFEKITVDIPEHPFVSNNQFFIAVDQLDSGVFLLSDNVSKSSFCSSDQDAFYFQLLKVDGAWEWETYSFAVDVVLDYPRIFPEHGMNSLASTLGIVDSMQYNRSIAWDDVNKDGYLDLLWDGRLYINRQGEEFYLANEDVGISGGPLLNLFIDANNDGNTDILFIGSRDSMVSPGYLYAGTGRGDFHRINLDIERVTNPTSYSITDVNGDGYLDLFIGQSCDSNKCSDILLINTGHNGFVRDTSYASASDPNDLNLSYGSQFVDIDYDGDQDLYIARRYPGHSLILYNDGFGKFTSNNASSKLYELGSASGGDWKDFDNDGDVDLLCPRIVHAYLRKFRGVEGSSIYASTGDAESHLEKISSGSWDESILYEERHAGGTWGDVNNDGLLDAFFGTSGDCRFAELYTQNADHSFGLNTFDYGLHWSAGGEDGIWVDYDNDGNLDLCVMEWGFLRLYKNSGGSEQNGYVEIDAIRPDGSPDIGASIAVYAGDLKVSRNVVVGRGILKGDPPRIHCGLGYHKQVDSVVVNWTNGVSETFVDVDVDAINKLVKGSTGTLTTSSSLAISAIPNPFSDQLHIYYTLPQSQKIIIEIYNSTGSLVRVLVDEFIPSGSHQVVWRGDNNSEVPVPQGIYTYRLITETGEVSGRAVLTR